MQLTDTEKQVLGYVSSLLGKAGAVARSIATSDVTKEVENAIPGIAGVIGKIAGIGAIAEAAAALIPVAETLVLYLDELGVKPVTEHDLVWQRIEEAHKTEG